ncbi:MAG TPA: hypothetical protein P5531_14055 [Bacteroidales bacterium]|nr:hypothetical protein [Bacteroidales bacterium]HSA44728.1 hypothetical protein [Bacteroidales bacterium]
MRQIKIKQSGISVLFLILMLASVILASCKPQRQACPAYGGEAKRFILERTY